MRLDYLFEPYTRMTAADRAKNDGGSLGSQKQIH
ncbi:hypothetical protein AB7M35_001798 [Amorphus suaedae]